MKMRFGTESDFEELKRELKKRLNAHPTRDISKPDFKQSAVMILLMNKGNEACVLLTKRTETVGTHKGQVALPGGGADSDDPDLLHTALRESHEEMGIDPDHVEVLGRFDDFISIAGFTVATFVGAIPYPYPYTISRDEIDDFVEVPLSIFAELRYDKKKEFEFEGNKYNIYYYYYNNFEIWGLTARILTDLSKKILSECGAPSQ